MDKVLAGSDEDHRYRPLKPEIPQTEKPPQKVKTYSIVKQLRDENLALQKRLNKELEKSLALTTEISKLKPVKTPTIKKQQMKVKPKTPKVTPKPRVVKRVAKKVTHKR